MNSFPAYTQVETYFEHILDYNSNKKWHSFIKKKLSQQFIKLLKSNANAELKYLNLYKFEYSKLIWGFQQHKI